MSDDIRNRLTRIKQLADSMLQVDGLERMLSHLNAHELRVTENDLLKVETRLFQTQMDLILEIGRSGTDAETISRMMHVSQTDVEVILTRGMSSDNEKLDKNIFDIGFSTRIISCLHAEKIYTLRDLVQWNETGLLKTPNLGRKSLNEIREVLAKYDLSLGMVFKI